MLEGKELLEKAKLLSKKSEDEIAKGCGYVGPSGRILRKSFYRALIEAKGYKIGNGRQGKNGNRTSRGRQTEYKTKVHVQCKIDTWIPIQFQPQSTQHVCVHVNISIVYR